MATRSAGRPQGRIQAFKAAVVEAVRSIFPSMGAADWRSAIRGEAAPRPNPRMRVHSNSFWYHIRPRALAPEATAWYYTFGLGWMSFFFFVVESISGAILMVYYTPSTQQAYLDMQRIISDVPMGNLLRNIHRLGAHVMVAVVFLHMMRTYFTASYKAPRQFIWVSGMVLLLLTLVLSFSGYLLPWDQLAYWAVTIGSSMAEAAPIVGSALNLLVRGGVDIGQGALLRFYLLHVFALPMITLIFISVHYYASRKQEISPIHELFPPDHPRGWGKPSRRKVPFLPDQVFFETAVVVLLTFAFIAINYFFWNAHLESHANPTQTPQHTKAPWYFLWLQGGLKFGDKLWFGLAWPAVIFGGLFLLPYLDRNPSRQFRHRKVALAGGALALVYLGYMSYAGLPEYGIQQTGSQELMTEFVPVEGEGILDEKNWAALPNEPTTFQVQLERDGSVDEARVIVNGAEPVDLEEANFLTPETRELFEEFEEHVVFWAQQDPRFLEPTAELIIEPWVYAFRENENGEQVPVTNPDTGQQELLVKRASVDLTFLSTEVNPNNGTIQVLEDEGKALTSRSVQTDFLHRDSHETPMEDVATEERQAAR